MKKVLGQDDHRRQESVGVRSFGFANPNPTEKVVTVMNNCEKHIGA